MSLYDSVRDLPLDDRRLRARRARAAGLERVPAQDDRDPARGRRRGRASARTSPTTRPSTTSQQARGAILPLAGRLDARHVLRAPRRRCRSSITSRSSTPTSTTAAGPSRAPPSISPFARPGSRSATAIGRVAAPLTFVVSMRLGEPATTERAARLARALSDPAVQARRDARLVGRADRRARRDGSRRLGRLQGPVPGHERRHRARRRRSTGGSSTGFPTRGSRIRPSRPRPRRCSSRTGTGSPGTP